MKSLALVVSVLLHPLLMATYGCLLLFFGIKGTIYDFMTPYDNKWRISLIVFVFSFLFPVLNIFILYKLNRIRSISLSNRSERTYPYILTAMFYFGLFYLLMDFNLWNVIKIFIIGGGLAIFATAIINLRYKISAHMVGVGGLLGVLMAVSYLNQFNITPVYILVILASGLIGFSRLVLNEHKPQQLYLGFLLGLSIQLGLFFALQKITFI